MSNRPGTVFIVAENEDAAFEEAARRGYNQEDNPSARFLAADGSTLTHTLVARRPMRYLNLSGRDLREDVETFLGFFEAEEIK